MKSDKQNADTAMHSVVLWPADGGALPPIQAADA